MFPKEDSFSSQKLRSLTGSNDQQKKDEGAFYVVGVGASAGGLEALREFFDNAPANMGMSFVVIQHLSPDYESHMVELLSKRTLMNVYQAQDGVEVEIDSIYLIPPKKDLTIFHGKLYLGERDYNRYHLNLPIDIFFKSLAEDQGPLAIGIILSGTGSDGTRGIRAIKDENGIVMVQDEKSAKFSGMPTNAIATGVVDYILPPQLMGKKLLEYTEHPYVNNYEDLDKVNLSKKDNFAKVLAIINSRIGVDFTYYKDNTILRRLERRMIINQVDSVDDYIEILDSTDQEVTTLYKELLIGVTQFFRNEEAFEILEEEVIPEIVKTKSVGDEIRVWIPGCSTGEEAYSLAILIKEYLDKNEKHLQIKIFASDISKEAIRYASMGEYPESIAADISLDRLEHFFIKKEHRYRVTKEIREMVIFSAHNLIKDPPFHKLDLISCRNLLIYFQAILQKKVLSLFHFSLIDNAFLLLGSSETIGEMDDYFATYNSKWRIYRCVGKDKRQIQKNIIKNFSSASSFRSKEIQNNFDTDSWQCNDENRLFNTISKALIRNYVPNSAIIDDNNKLIHVIGDISKYLKIPTDMVSLDVLKMSTQELSMSLGVAINKVRESKEKAVFRSIKFDFEGTERINLVVTPLKEPRTEKELIIISFEETQSEVEIIDSDENIGEKEKYHRRIESLEQDLGYTRENLQATVEELEASNEELQATNEELLASNEELQSTNEELESVNEELITVNSEHQSKIEELTRLNDDMDNLLKSTEIGTIFLDNQLKVRRFTPAIKENINLMECDVGRPIEHISNNINYDNLLNDAEEVLESLIPKEINIETKDGSFYLARILPYRTDDNLIKGIVITLVDISEYILTSQQLHKLTYTVEENPYMIVITDTEGEIDYVNTAFSKITGYQKEEVLGAKANILKSEQTTAKTYQELWTTINSGEKWQGELCNQRRDGSTYWERATIFPIIDEEGEVSNFIKMAHPIVQEKACQKELLELKAENKRLKEQGGS